MTTIGVFDSGVGGKSVARALALAMPDAHVAFRHDSQHMPYGDKTPQQLLGYIVPILQSLVEEGCEVIVVACNSATTTLIAELRARIAVPLVGVEPMIKPAAAQTKTGVIAVCATPMTLASPRYAWLKETYATGITVLEPACNDWAYMIEHNQVNEAHIRSQITDLCDQNADVIVLGCTHYHWIEETIQEMTEGRAIVIQPEQAIVRQVQRQLRGLAQPA